jgi:hypothetical protein
MSEQALRRLVHDAETRPSLREVLRRCSSWAELIERAVALGYGVTLSDLAQAFQAETASGFLRRSRIAPVPDLMEAVPGRGAQLSWRRLARTSR